MKNYKKLLLMMLVLCIGIVGLAAPGMAGETMDKIKKSGKIVMGVNATYAPFEFHVTQNGKDKVVGFDIDLGQAIADALGVKLVVEDMAFDGLLPSLVTGKVDFLPGLAATPERKQNVDFTIPYHKSTQLLIVRKGEEKAFPAKSTLAGKTVGVLKGSIQSQTLAKHYAKAKPAELGKISDLIMSLKNKKVDAIMLDQTPAALTVKANPDLSLCGVKFTLSAEDDPGSSVLIRKNNDDLKTVMNETLKRVMHDGSLKKWEDNALALMGTDSLK